jgi:NitT/TauT family transport system substrate-binding protein
LTIADYTSATIALNAALSNQVNLAISSEYAFVATNVLKQGNLHVIATVDKSESVSIVGRMDRGIENISDLEGKRIGLSLQIAPQFYLATFLELNNVNTQNITLVNVPTTAYVSAIVNGTVDAVVVSESSIPQIKAQLPDDIVIWSVQSGRLLDMVVSCRNDWITQHPELVTRFLKSLAQAEAYVDIHPAQAESIIRNRINATDAYMAEIWPNHTFSLSLDQSLVATLENEARWIISNNLTNQTAVPDFLNYIYLQGLMSVKPESVNIIH